MGEEKKVKAAIANGEILHCTRTAHQGTGMCQEKVKYLLRFRPDPCDGWGVTLYPRCSFHMHEDKKLAIDIDPIDPRIIPLK